jgi:hypothetical protein
MDSHLGLLFCSTGLIFCASSTLFLLLWLCSIVWSQYCDTSNIALFAQYCLGYTRSFAEWHYVNKWNKSDGEGQMLYDFFLRCRIQES